MAKPQISLELSPGMGFRGLVYAPGIPKSVAPAHDATSSTSISLKLGALFDNQGYPTQRQVQFLREIANHIVSPKILRPKRVAVEVCTDRRIQPKERHSYTAN
jgi:hypothetical protein